MTQVFNKDSFSSTYKDDWSADNHYHKILFNNGRPLQARELTQVQSIIQAEIASMGKNLFKEGAAVNPGGASLNAGYRFVQISSTGENDQLEDVSVGDIFQNTSGVKARVLETVSTNGSDPDTMYLQYIDAGLSGATTETVQFIPGETITGSGPNDGGNGFSFTVATGDAVGSGVKFTSASSDFFVLGHFVSASAQSLILSKYSPIANAVVGFKIIQDIVSVDDSVELYDNSGANPNFASPGADRYRIRLELTTEDLIEAGETFVFYCKVENSVIVDHITGYDDYNKINDLIALRTFEESGNYIVNPFFINFQEDALTPAGYLDLIVSAGTAYVNGYRVNNPSPIKLSVPKSQSIETVTNQAVSVSFGNYVWSDYNLSLPALNSTVKLFSGVSGTGEIGTARIKSIEEADAKHKIFLYDIVMSNAQGFSETRSIGNSGTDYIRVDFDTSVPRLIDAANNDLLFHLPRPRPSAISNIDITVQQEFAGTPTGNSITISVSGSKTFTDSSYWVVCTDGAQIVASPAISVTNQNQQATISGLPNTPVKILAYVRDGAGQVADKALSTTTTLDPVGLTTEGDVTFINLGVHDIYEVSSVFALDDFGAVTGSDISSFFTLDNGQRDNYYDIGKLIKRPGVELGTSFQVNFKYFQRTTSGNFYAAESYDVDYNSIPVHYTAGGDEIKLYNVLDFRPDKLANGSFTNTKQLPRNASTFSANIEFYLPRADKLLITKEGSIQVLKGSQSQNPQFKKTPEDTLELYKIILNANTLSINDLRYTAIEHKLFTMADINKIEKKLDKLEQTTSLNLLELQSKFTPVYDAAGTERPVSGFVVDNFADQTLSATGLNGFSASIDPVSKLMRPSFREDNIRLIYDETASSNTTLKGDNVYLSYTEDNWNTQNQASKTEVINSTGIVDNIGHITLSPSSDEWKETEYEATYALSGSNSIDTVEAFLWNSWNWNWIGTNPDEAEQQNVSATGGLTVDPLNSANRVGNSWALNNFIDVTTDPSASSSNTSVSGTVNRVIASDSLRVMADGRVIDVALIPWIRSRRVFFKAQGLKPNTTFIPYFDGTRVDDWCKGETYQSYASRSDDQGNQYTNASVSEHPWTKSSLVTDGEGTVTGSFFIPNVRPTRVQNSVSARPTEQGGIRFRCGVREFKLLDITQNDYNAAGSKAVAFYTARGFVDKSQSGVWSTRNVELLTPYANNNASGMFPAYSETETNQYADGVTPQLIEPRIPGEYGPDDSPISTVSTYSGNYSVISSDYVNVNGNQTTGTNVIPMTKRVNPLAQTFFVDNQFGVVLTKAQLFFSAADAELPVQIQIRPMVNGAPSENLMVPGSCVFVNASTISSALVDPTGNDLAAIQASPVSFEFDEPIYLNAWTEYALVVITQSTNYELWVAESEEFLHGSNQATVSSANGKGRLFKPQNSTVWQASINSSLMYNLVRAKFSTTGSAILSNAFVPATLLENNPIYTTQGSNNVYIRHPGHGLRAGDTAVLLGLEPTTTYGGILGSAFNATHTVIDHDAEGYRIQLAGANSTTISGGDSVLSARNIVFDIVTPYIESVLPQQTSLESFGKFTTGTAVSQNPVGYNKDTVYYSVMAKNNRVFSSPKVLAHSVIETVELGSGVSSADIKVDLKSASDYVSPILDLQRCSLITVENFIDDTSITPLLVRTGIDETGAYDNSSAARHITSPVVLAQEAVGMQVLISANVPLTAAYDVYYRTAVDGENLYEQTWVAQSASSPVPKDDNPQVYRETEFLAGGTEGTLSPFTQAQIKIVMHSTNSSLVPKFRDLRIKFLAL